MLVRRQTSKDSKLGMSLLLAALGGCSGAGSTGNSNDGGTTSNGGSPAGGAATAGAAALGGSIATGGTSSNAGAPAAGGAKSTGGAMSTRGGNSSGGAPIGGMIAAGNSSAAGGLKGTGGVAGNGGSPSGGGTPSLGEDTATAGSKGTAGAFAAAGAAGGSVGERSPGCTSGMTTSSCSKSGGTKCTLTSNAKSREYYLILPPNYDPSRPYPVVIMLHGMIATAEMALSWFKEIPTNMPDAIYIAPQGLKHAETGGGANGREVTGWANVDGEDIQFMKDLLSSTQRDYCVDTQRAFAVGFSYGAMFSYAIGCELGGMFRAIAPMSGALLSGCNLSGKPIAMWGSHGTSDSLVPIASGRQARDKILQQSHCGTGTAPVEPSPCVAYQGCDRGYPVTWCEWDGDHDRPPFGNTAVAAFFKQF
jgi:polyhydroxybutyrate depolymerase